MPLPRHDLSPTDGAARGRRTAAGGVALALAAGALAVAGGATTAAASPSTSTPAAAMAATAVAKAPRPTARRRARIPAGFPTGATAGARWPLRTMSGPTASRLIDRDGAVLRNARVFGQITVEHDHVRLENVRVKTGSSYGILTYGRGTVVRDSTVVGTPGDTLAGIAAYERGTVHAIRVDVSRTEDGVRLADDSVLRGSIVHGLAGDGASHFDAVTADGYTGWRIMHNTILNPFGQTAAVWVGDSRYGGSAGIMAGNLLAGGGYTVYSGTGVGPGIRVRNNRFSTRFHRHSGYWGTVYEWVPQGNTWTGNRWADGPRRGRTVRP